MSDERPRQEDYETYEEFYEVLLDYLSENPFVPSGGDDTSASYEREHISDNEYTSHDLDW